MQFTSIFPFSWKVKNISKGKFSGNILLLTVNNQTIENTIWDDA